MLDIFIAISVFFETLALVVSCSDNCLDVEKKCILSLAFLLSAFSLMPPGVLVLLERGRTKVPSLHLSNIHYSLYLFSSQN